MFWLVVAGAAAGALAVWVDAKRGNWPAAAGSAMFLILFMLFTIALGVGVSVEVN